MNEVQIRERMMERLLAAQTPWGRFHLNAYVKWKRMAWQLVVGSAYFIKRTLDIIISISIETTTTTSFCFIDITYYR